jgi:transglutaminase-like putative cysteine protease
MTKWYLLGLLAAAAWTPHPLLAGKIDPDDPPQGLFSDDWMVALLGGQKAGYVHTTMFREGDEITTRAISVLSIARGAVAMEVSTMESYIETVAGAPISFESTNKLATMTTVTRGRVRDDQIEIERTQFGMTQTERIPYPKGALMGWGRYAEEVRRGLKEGLTYELDAYVPSLKTDQAVKTRVTIAGRETVDLPDEHLEAIRITTTMSTPVGSMDVVSWVTEDWTLLKSRVQTMGLSIEMVRTDKQTALKDVTPPELFVDTLVKTDKKIDRAAARSIRYRLGVTGEGEPVPDLPITGMQKPGQRTDNGLDLEVTRQDHKALRKAKLPQQSEEFAESLQANIWINSDDPQVITMAKDAAGDATKPYEVADRLRKYATEVIDEKNLNVGFATASEVCRNKEGDCSEHAVLLAALGRVHKIPSRVVIGLVYVPNFAGAKNVFGFHMWTQFNLGGQWVDFDAAQDESDCNATHIALATSSLAHSSLADLSFSLLNVIGRLKIDVLEAKPRTAVSGAK